MIPLDDPLIRELMRKALAHRPRRKEDTARVRELFARRQCLMPLCEEAMALNGNCQRHDNATRHRYRSIAADQGVEAAERFLARLIRQGHRLAAGEAVRLRRAMQIEAAAEPEDSRKRSQAG